MLGVGGDRLMKTICTSLAVALVLALMVGCQSGPSLIEQDANRDLTSYASSPAKALPSIEGEWRFVYMNKPLLMFGKDFSPPPAFDSIDFQTNGTVRLVNSMSHHDFLGTYQVDGDKVKWTFTPPNITNSIEHELIVSWAEQGKALVLRPAEDDQGIPVEAEWTYYRPERLFPVDPIVGKWITSSEGETTDMTFEQDGSFHMAGKKCWGYYRLWRSNHGNTLTTPIWIQGEGGFIINYLYMIESNTLTLTPLGHDGPHKQGITVWNKETTEHTQQPDPKRSI
jgi:hypothetical protein